MANGPLEKCRSNVTAVRAFGASLRLVVRLPMYKEEPERTCAIFYHGEIKKTQVVFVLDRF